LFLLLPLVASAASGTLVYATYVGGSGTDAARAMVVDASGNVYLAGTTIASSSGLQSGFLTKVNADGSTSNPFYPIPAPPGGSLTVTAVALDANLNTVVAGYSTTSTGSISGFVDKFDPTGKQLFATSFNAMALALALDAQGNIYVTGYAPAGLQTTSGVLQSANAGGYDAVALKLNSSGVIVYATYLGGSEDDLGYAIAVNASGQVCIAGSTASADFPLRNAAQAVFGGAIQALGAPFTYGDAFVAKLDANGANLLYSTYWGGSQPDIAYGIAFDATGNAYIAGATQSANFPVSSGAFQTTYGGGTPVSEGPDPDGDAFLAKFDPNGASVWSTFLGGSSDDHAAAIALDAGGDVYVAGTTESTNFPGFQNWLPSCRVIGRPFVAELDSAGDKLIASIGLPGLGYDEAAALAVNATGVYVAGAAESRAFFVYGATVQKTYGGGETDAFAAKLNLAASPGVFPTCVVNAASFVAGNQANFLNGAVAPGEIVTVGGVGLGPTPAAASPQLISSGAVATLLGGTQVLFDGIPAPMIYAGASQLNIVVPYGIDSSSTSMTVEAGGVQSDSVLMPVAQAVPAIFTIDGSGVGQAVVLNQDYSVNSVSNPAARGSYIMIYAEGAGLMTPAMPDGWVAPPALPLPAPVLQPVTATVRGADAPVQYAGAAPGFVSGVLQVNVQVPTNIDFGNSVPLFLYAGPPSQNYSSQYNVTIAVK
jgi:uncharacterized protein (TIGR03437 family)